MKVLVVCSGNICRSPMVAEYLRHRAAQDGLHHVVVDSAGTLGIEGQPASAEAIEALREIGLDLSGHRSRGLRATDLADADLVLAMTQSHVEELAARFPQGAERRLLLRAFEGSPRIGRDAPDLPDPIGRGVEVYREQLMLIRRSIDHLALRLQDLTSEFEDADGHENEAEGEEQR